MGGRRNGWRGGYRFSSLMKQKKGGEIALSFTSPEKEKRDDVVYWDLIQ